MKILRAFWVLSLSISAVAEAQGAPEWTRANRIVLYSPHFDGVPEPYGGLSCPRQPLRLYGFETTTVDTIATLLVRLDHAH